MDLQLETPRLVLTPLMWSDLMSLRSLLIDPDVRRWATTDGRVLSEADIRWSVRESNSTFRRRGTGGFALRLRADGAFAGYAGLLPEQLHGQEWLELSVALRPRYWRAGLAVEACRAILDDAFGRIGVPRVCACCLARNLRSLALVSRLGFRQVETVPAVLGALRVFACEAP